MQIIRLMYDNFFDSGTLTYSSQHSNFPATNIQHRWYTRTWRSNYGASSGWGNFTIESGVNDKIDFQETAATPLVATLTAGDYDTDDLIAEIEAQLESAGASDYTVSYDDDTNKFTIASDGAGGGGIFELLWSSGTNTATSVASTLGFDNSADDTGALSYTADSMRIHSEEWIKIDRGESSPGALAAMIRYNNFSSNATIQIQGNASDSWGSPTYSEELTIDNTIMSHFFSTAAQELRWWRIRIRDVSNSDGYVAMGRPFVGPYSTFSKNFNRAYQKMWRDPSLASLSEGGQLSSILRSKYNEYIYQFMNMSSDDKDTIEALFDSRGLTKDFFVCQDADNASTTTYYAQFSEYLRIVHVLRDQMFNFRVALRELR